MDLDTDPSGLIIRKLCYSVDADKWLSDLDPDPDPGGPIFGKRCYSVDKEYSDLDPDIYKSYSVLSKRSGSTALVLALLSKWVNYK